VADRSSRLALHVATLAIGSLAATASVAPGIPNVQDLKDERPNILLIISDDQRHDTMTYMPRTQALIFDQGVTFTRGYVTTGECCPSRSSILTGMYAHNHGVLTNDDNLREETMVEHLDEGGYYTGLVGKYLNTYPSCTDPPLPEFDYWVALYALSAQTASYVDPRLNVNGEWARHEGYQTTLLRDYALEFLQEADQQEDPFFLIYAPFAPHLPARPAPGDETLYPDFPEHRPPSFDEDDLSDKPAWLQEFAPLTPEQIETIDKSLRRQAQTLNALDESVERLLAELEAQGELDNTLIIYLSDNGKFAGEHRKESGKANVYEEVTRVPFAVRYPPLVAEPRTDTHLVANIDVAPTIYDVAGLSIPPDVDGLSLVPLLQGQQEGWREHLLIEAWPPFKVVGLPYKAIHTGRYVYVETESDSAELYDLVDDPYQLQNQIDNPDYADVLVDLRARLDEEKADIKPPPIASRASPIGRRYLKVKNSIAGLTNRRKYLIGTGILLLAGLLVGHKHLRRLVTNPSRTDAWALAAAGLVIAALAALADDIGLSNSPGKLGTIQIAGIVAGAVLFAAGLLILQLSRSRQLPK